MDEARANSARRRFRLGLVLTGVVALSLAIATDLHVREVLSIPLFMVFFPAVAWAQLPLMAEEALPRVPVYLGSIVSISLLGLLALGLGVWGFDPGDLALAGLPAGELLLWTLGITALALLAAAPIDWIERRLRGGPQPILLQLLPRTSRERGVFAGLSLTAGWGEELAYRGYVPAALLLLLGEPWLAMAVAAIGFGALHSYQGGIGVVRTAMMGFLLGVPVVVTGSILPGMLAHALVDLIAGFFLAPRILRRAEADGMVLEVAPAPAPSDTDSQTG